MSKKTKFSHLPLSTRGPLECAVTGSVLLNTPYFNHGSAHTASERHEFNLTGLLPESIQTLEQQVKRAYQQYTSRPDNLAKNTFLTSLKEQNAVLYYRLLQDHLKEMFGVVYTPTEGDAIQNFSRIFRRPDGCFLNINDIDRVSRDLAQWGRPEDIDYIVVSDGEEILGIGDQGVGAILISVAKLALTTLCSGIHPNRTLPVVLDCGTDNEKLLDDELYLGLRQKRVRGEKYDEFVDEFVRSARKLFPRAYIHFEDFGITNARRILDHYRPEIPCFNDDIQGTGCVTLAAIMAGLHVSKQTLKDIKLVVFGAGTAGVGIADQVRDAIATEKGVSKEEAAKQIWLIDKPGLLTTSTPLDKGQKLYAKDSSEWTSSTSSSSASSSSSSSSSSSKDHPISLLSVIKKVHPNVLIGTSTVPKSFTQEIITEMATHVSRPVVLPLSNPTRLHEAAPRDILTWTDGRALVATGSPFDPVTGPWGRDGADITVDVAECNNSVVFPGIGLGCVLSRASILTDKMLVAAVRGVVALSPALLRDDAAPLLPGVEAVRDVSVRVASEVVKAAVAEGVATQPDIPDDEELEEWIRAQLWEAVYRPLVRVDPEGASRGARAELKVVGSLG